MRWRRRYLEITYGCGPYRPYETLVREAAHDVGLPERLGEDLERRWTGLQPWPEANRVLAKIPVPLAVEFPFPAWATRLSECAEPPRPAAAPQADVFARLPVAEEDDIPPF